MRRAFVIPAVLVGLLACKGADKEATGTTTETTGKTLPGSQGPALELPAVELPAAPVDRGDANLWISADAIWIAGSEGAPQRVVELESISDTSPELIEALAEALHRLAGDRSDEGFILSLQAGFELVLRVDQGTTLAVLRRVLTTARATGHRRIRYASATGSVELSAQLPVRDGSLRAEQLVISGSPSGNDGLALNRSPMAREALLTKLERSLQISDERCVLLDLAPTASYAEWLTLAAELAAIDVDCVTVPSSAVQADANEPPPPPPPPPPPADEDEDDFAEPEPEPKPKSDPASARVEHWWSLAQAQADDRARARCEQALTPLRELAESELSAAQLQQLTNLEDNCGDSARAGALRVLRTERFPDDWRGWHALAVSRYEPLFPDPESGLPYQPDVDPEQRKAIAEQVLAALEQAQALAPTERDPRVWAAMAHTQLALAWESDPSEVAQRHARVEHMRAWKQQQPLCEPDCPSPPSTEEQHTADLAALAEAP